MHGLLGAIFQQDNARSHTARVSQDCNRTVTIIPLPARSRDMSPIESIWNHFGSTNTNHAKAMLSATIAVFFTVAPTGRNPYMGRARFELRTGVTINEETTPENNKQKKLYVFL
ncbi:hypothetical protein TNCV_4888201 [Trichonephila clavipes]|nr:hypothetical protein TNCV_4888201 [Trichonephila clavipes]